MRQHEHIIRYYVWKCFGPFGPSLPSRKTTARSSMWQHEHIMMRCYVWKRFFNMVKTRISYVVNSYLQQYKIKLKHDCSDWQVGSLGAHLIDQLDSNTYHFCASNINNLLSFLNRLTFSCFYKNAIFTLNLSLLFFFPLLPSFITILTESRSI